MDWTLLSVMLCVYGFAKDFKPGEPFLFMYQNEHLNLTRQQLNGEVYPWWTYGYLVSLVPILLLTDLLLYKPVLILESVGYIVFRSTLVFGSSVLTQQIGQVCYGIASASEIAFYSYIYARVDKSSYRELTSWTRAAMMAGRCFGYLFSQLCLLTGFASLLRVNEISLASPVLGIILGLWFPRVHWKQLVTRMIASRGLLDRGREFFVVPQSYAGYARLHLRQSGSALKAIYSDGFVRKWSLWWAMTTCMSLFISQYSQTLFALVQTEKTAFNGFCDAIYTGCAVLAIMVMQAFPFDWDRWGECALVVISTVDCALLLLFRNSTNIYVMYACYITYRTLFQVMITIAQWNLARKIQSECFGLMFGLNSFVALVLQTVMTFVIVDERGLGLDVRDQFVIYAGYHAVIAVIFLGAVLHNLVSRFGIASDDRSSGDEKQLTTSSKAYLTEKA